jgi:hypothetical protein
MVFYRSYIQAGTRTPISRSILSAHGHFQAKEKIRLQIGMLTVGLPPGPPRSFAKIRKLGLATDH